MPEVSETQFTTADFFTAGTFATLAGSSAAVLVLAGTVTEVAKLATTPSWLGLSLAMACSLAAYVYATRRKLPRFRKTPRYVRYALVVLNGCLIFSSAFGIQAALGSAVAIEASGSELESGEAAYTLSSWEPLLAPKESRTLRTRRPPSQH